MSNDPLKAAAAIEDKTQHSGTALVVKPETGATIAEASGMSEEQFALINRAIQENISSDVELRYSRLALLQALSPEIVDQQPGYKQGQLIDNVSREIYSLFDLPPWLKGKVPDEELKKLHFLPFLPVFKLPSEFIHWKNRKTEGKGMHWKTLDSQDPRVIEGIWPPRGKWQPPKDGQGSKAPPVTENCNMLGICMDAEFDFVSAPLVATFAKTNFDSGRTLVTACNQHGLSGLPFWGRIYYLWTFLETYGDNKCYIVKVAKGPKLLDVCSNKSINKHMASLNLMLADPEHGKERQERIINAAVLEDSDDGTAGSDVATDDNDPFAAT